MLLSYLASRRRPWRLGYSEYRERFLTHALRDDSLLATFREERPLPRTYGRRLDARVVEVPWVLSRLPRTSSTILDAGSSLNYEHYLTAPPLVDKHLTILTLAPERRCYAHRRISYVFDDLRHTSLRDSSFDQIVCISTLEHVGMNNALYTGEENPIDPISHLDAIREFRRVLKPGGTLFLTVPFGRRENHGWLQQFDEDGVDLLVRTFIPERRVECVYRYTALGWELSTRVACADAQYFDVRAFRRSASGERYPSDHAAGERAVICLALRKPQ